MDILMLILYLLFGIAKFLFFWFTSLCIFYLVTGQDFTGILGRLGLTKREDQKDIEEQ